MGKVDVFTSALEVIGLLLILVCAYVVFPPAAFGVGGVELLLVARGLDARLGGE